MLLTTVRRPGAAAASPVRRARGAGRFAAYSRDRSIDRSCRLDQGDLEIPFVGSGSLQLLLEASADRPGWMLRLPDELRCHICSFVPPTDALCVALASRALQRSLNLPADGWRTFALASPSRLEWAHLHGYTLSETTARRAAMTGNLSVLQAARDLGCPWDKHTCEAAATGGHVDVVLWARSNGCPWDDATRHAAADAGYLELARWLYTNGCRPLPNGDGATRGSALPSAALRQPQREWLQSQHDAVVRFKREERLRTAERYRTRGNGLPLAPSGRPVDALPCVSLQAMRQHLDVQNRRSMASAMAPVLRDGTGSALSQHQAVAETADGERRQIPKFPLLPWTEWHMVSQFAV